MIENLLLTKRRFLSTEEISQKLNIINNLKFKNWNEFLKDQKRVLIGVNDATRVTPTEEILDFLLPVLKLNSVEPFFIVATGTHRPPSENELKSIFGLHYSENLNIVSHDHCTAEWIHFGETKRKTAIKISSYVQDFERIIYIGSIEPHYFAGFTGGRKFLLPGISSYDSTKNNHFFACLKSAQPAVLEGNPVHEDMMEFSETVIEKSKFSLAFIHTVTISEGIIDLEVGDLKYSFFNMIQKSLEALQLKQEKKLYDIVVCKVPDFASDLYQGLKGFEHHKHLVKENGKLILFGKLSNGIGPENYFRQLVQNQSLNRINIKKMKENYNLGDHKAINILTYLLEGKSLIVVSENKILKSQLDKTLLSYSSDINDFLKIEEKRDILIVPESVNTITVKG